MKNNKLNKLTDNSGPGNFICAWHLTIVVLCFAAWLTGDIADDYKKLEYTGFIIHGYLGMALSVAVFIYLGYGIAGPRQFRFSKWLPFTGERLRQARYDLADLVRFKLPEHKRRQGVAGLVQFFGILLFFWLASTGSLLYFFVEPGSKVRGLMHTVKEAHEVGGILIPLYLGLHIGAVIAHSLTGNHVWKEIFFQKNRSVEK